VVAQRRKHKGFNSFYSLAASPSAPSLQAFKGQSRSISSDNERINSSGGFLVSPYTSWLYAPTHAPQPPALVATPPLQSTLSVDTVFGFAGTLPSMLAAARDSSDIVYVPLRFPQRVFVTLRAATPAAGCASSCPTKPATKRSSAATPAP